MAAFYADENFPHEVVEELRRLGYDVLTSAEANQANRGVPDETVLAFVARQGRALLTLNRWDFVRLHRAHPEHAGIVVCSVDPDPRSQAERIGAAVRAAGSLSGQLVRVDRPT